MIEKSLTPSSIPALKMRRRVFRWASLVKSISVFNLQLLYVTDKSHIKSNQIFHYTPCNTLKRVTNWRGPSPRHCAWATQFLLKKCCNGGQPLEINTVSKSPTRTKKCLLDGLLTHCLSYFGLLISFSQNLTPCCTLDSSLVLHIFSRSLFNNIFLKNKD